MTLWTLYLVDCLSTFHLVLFLKLCLVLSIGTYSFASLLCLILCVCSYVLGKSATSPRTEGVALFRRYPVGLKSTILHGHQSQELKVYPLCGLCALLPWCAHGCCCGALVGRAGPGMAAGLCHGNCMVLVGGPDRGGHWVLVCRVIPSWLWGLAEARGWVGLSVGSATDAKRLTGDFQNGTRQHWH